MKTFENGALEVVGFCMSPVLRPGDQIRWRRARAEELRWGDIVVFLRPDPRAPWALSAHRYLRRRRAGAGWEFWTRGDASRLGAEWTPGSAVAGVVVARRRPGEDWVALDGAWRRLLGLAASASLLLRQAFSSRPRR